MLRVFMGRRTSRERSGRSLEVRLVINFAQQIFDPDAPKTGLDEPAQDFHFRRYGQSIANMQFEPSLHNREAKGFLFMLRAATLATSSNSRTKPAITASCS